MSATPLPLTPAQEQRLRVWSLTSPEVRGPKFPWDELRGLFDLLDAERAARTPAAPASGDAREVVLEAALRKAMRCIASAHECTSCVTGVSTQMGVEGHEESCVYAAALRGQP